MTSPPDTSVRAISVNGLATTTGATTVADLVAEQGLADLRVATALNGDFVAAAARAITTLKDGDRVEIVSPRQGG
jgi:sulfur carrier protein